MYNRLNCCSCISCFQLLYDWGAHDQRLCQVEDNARLAVW